MEEADQIIQAVKAENTATNNNTAIIVIVIILFFIKLSDHIISNRGMEKL